MTDEKLEKLLKEDVIDVPEVKVNSKKIVEYCKEKTNKRNTRQKRLIISLSSFVLLILIVLSLGLMNNQYYSSINKAIDSLDSINDSSVRMQEIMKIDKEIKTLSLNKQEKVNMDKLSYELKTTTTNLKNEVEWNDVINNEATYFTFDEIINKNDIKELFVKKA